MIQTLLKRDLNGAWTTPNNALLGPLETAVKSSAEKIQKLKILGSSQSNAGDCWRGLYNLNRNIQVITASLQTIEASDRQTLAAHYVDLAVSIRNLKSTLIDPTNPLLIELNQIIGEVPTMHEAAREGYKEIVELLLTRGAKVDAANDNDWEPLHEAAKSGQKEVAELLLTKGAKVDPSDKYGWQPLHWAAKCGQKEMVAFLIEKGASEEAKAKDGKRPLHIAAWYGHKEIVELLLAKGAQADALDNNGKLPSEEAERGGQREIAKILQSAAFNEPLLSVYRKQGYLTRFLDKKPFPIEKSYINVAIVDQESYESSRDANKCIALSELFNGNSQLYIEGAAGSGKTTLCRYLVSTWANSCSKKRLEIVGPWANRYESIIFLPLREIRSLSETATLKEFVLERYPGFLFDKIDPKKTLYILDGFDEIASLEETCSKEDRRWKIVETLLQQPHYIVTSRPNLFSERFYRCRRFQNIGFTIENIEAYVVRFCEDFKIEYQRLEKAILYHGDLRALARIPLYLELICSLWKEHPQALSNQYNFATLYKEMAALLFRRLLMRLEVSTKGLLPHEILSHKALIRYRETLEAIAFDSKRLGGNRIGPEIYRRHLQEIPSTERQTFGKHLFDEMGLLTPIGDPKELLDQVYSYIHPTFEEYFAARCLLSRLDSSSQQVSRSAADWLIANRLSKSYGKMMDFAAAFASTEKEISSLVEALLSNEQQKNSQLNGWQFPLHRAAAQGLLNVSACLLKYGAKVDAKDSSGAHPLHHAAESGHKEVVELLLKHGAKIDAVDTNVNYGNQPLHLAAQKGCTKVVELLLQKGAKVDAVNNRGMQPIHLAAQQGQVEVVGLFLHYGAKVNAATSFGQHPIHFAAENGHKEVLELLLKNGAKVNAAAVYNSEQPLHFAARSGNKEAVELLLKYGGQMDAFSSDGWQPLHEAAGSGHLETVELLLKRGAKVNNANFEGRQPLLLAASYGRRQIYFTADAGHKEVAELLIKYGAKVDAADNRGARALHYASSMGNTQLVELLLNKGADVDAPDNDGRPPLHWAARNGNKTTVELLLNRGAKVNAADDNGWQTLHVAAKYGNKEIAELLLKRGAKVNAAARDGQLPRDLAASYPDIVKLLVSK